MEQLINSQYSALVPLLMRNMSEYFVEFHPTRDSNLYVRFIKELRPVLNDILFSTINYDLLFEHAVKHNGLLVTRLKEIQDRVHFLKLHGSCDFIAPKGSHFSGDVFVGPGPMIGMPLRDDATVDETICFCYSQDISPAICLFMREKVAQFGYNIILELQDIWKKRVSKAERILLVGVRPNKYDLHIWDSLKQTDAIIGFIGKKDRDYNDWVRVTKKNIVYLGEEWDKEFDKSTSFLK